MRILFAGLLLPLAACNVGTANTGGDDGRPGIPAQGTGATRTFAVADFTAVDLRGSDNVDVRVGPGFSVRADGDPEVLDRLRITKEGNTLRIARRDGTSSGEARIAVTLPMLAAASAAGSGDMTIDRAVGARFRGEAAGSGRLAIAALQVQQAELALAGSGDIEAAGTARQLTVDLAGSGDVDAGRLTASAADISVAGSGSVTARVEGPAKVSVAGSGDVDLGDKAQCQTSKLGSGSVRCAR